jgi:hypothetical protein
MRQPAILGIVLLTVAASPEPGSLALEAIQANLAPEMLHLTCVEGNQDACVMADLDPVRVKAVMIKAVQSAQRACAHDPESEDCDDLRQFDQAAEQVLATHRL